MSESIGQALQQSHADQNAFTQKMRTLAARARDTALDDETRYAAVTEITAEFWRRKRPRENVVDREPPAAERLQINPTKPQKNLVTLPPKPQGGTIKEYAEQLLRHVVRVENGQNIGLSYAQIRTLILKRFPTVTLKGQWFGRPTTMHRKELHTMACALNKRSVALPFRSRSFRHPDELARTIGGRSRPRPQRQPKDVTTSAISRAAAKASGAVRYFTGKRCVHGHMCERITSNGLCVQCHRDQVNTARPRKTTGRMAVVETPDVIFTHTCVQCGAPFRPACVDSVHGQRRPALYCSHRCSQAAYRLREALGDKEVAA